MPDTDAPPKKPRASRKRDRQPTQERGVIRYNQLLDATHQLLSEHEIEDLGIYQISKQAGVPPASAYHFFPTPGAVLLGLAKRYLDEFKAINLAEASGYAGNWQQLVRDRLTASSQVFNANPPMRKMFLGCRTTRELVLCNHEFNQMMAERLVQEHIRMYHVPLMDDAPRKYMVALTAVDAVWTLSCTWHDSITPAYLEESVDLAIAYFRTFLPDRLVPRDEPLERPTPAIS